MEFLSILLSIALNIAIDYASALITECGFDWAWDMTEKIFGI